MRAERLLPGIFVTFGLALALLLVPSHPAIIASAQPQGWVEDVSKRTRNSKTWADLDNPGRFRWSGSVGKIHWDGPDWKDVDNTLLPSSANVPTLGLADLEMTTDDYEFYALQTLNTIPLWFYRNKSLPDTYV
ncbi:MAG: hypothetical protein GTO14_07645, partial [Anaerolineales bacterium]|nr:hypothetical protein [Anaerolineales bacterium]